MSEKLEFPPNDQCWKCKSTLTERKFWGGDRLSWHCKSCGYDWQSRTWDSGPLPNEHLCWFKSSSCLVCTMEEEAEKAKKDLNKLAKVKSVDQEIANDEEVPI